MQAEIEFVAMERSKALEKQIRAELEKIEDRYNWVTNAIAYLKPGQAAQSTFIFELELRVPGTPIFVKEENDTFEFAISNVFKTINRQLEKRKQKMYHGT